jgi:hypothetical protein
LNHAIQGTVIGKPKFYIFGGDLCQSGGKYEWKDQFDQTPLTYAGGPQLAYIRYLFDNKWVPPSWFKSQMIWWNVDTVYFGLGNHDIESTDHPNVSWLGFNLKFEGSHDDYFRYQMWNFICQMHTGLKTKDGEVPPRFPITERSMMAAEPETIIGRCRTSTTSLISTFPPSFSFIDMVVIGCLGGTMEWNG